MNDLQDIDLPTAKLAYTIIQGLLDANESLGDLLAVMSHAMDEDIVKAMTNTGEWENYLESKRNLETTKVQIEKFTSELKKWKMENGKWKMASDLPFQIQIFSTK